MSRNLYWIAGAAIVLSVPIVPDSMKISVSMDPPRNRKPEKPYSVVSAACTLKSETISDQGLQVCEYRCNDDNHQIIYKTSRPNVVCQNTINEQLKQTKRK